MSTTTEKPLSGTVEQPEDSIVQQNSFVQGNLNACQVNLQIPLSAGTVKKNPVLFPFPNSTEFHGARTVETEHNATRDRLSPFEDRFRRRKGVHQQLVVLAQCLVDEVFQIGKRFDGTRCFRNHIVYIMIDRSMTIKFRLFPCHDKAIGKA